MHYLWLYICMGDKSLQFQKIPRYISVFSTFLKRFVKVVFVHGPRALCDQARLFALSSLKTTLAVLGPVVGNNPILPGMARTVRCCQNLFTIFRIVCRDGISWYKLVLLLGIFRRAPCPSDTRGAPLCPFTSQGVRALFLVWRKLPFFGQNCSLPFSLRSLDIPALLKSWQKHYKHTGNPAGWGWHFPTSEERHDHKNPLLCSEHGEIFVKTANTPKGHIYDCQWCQIRREESEGLTHPPGHFQSRWQFANGPKKEIAYYESVTQQNSWYWAYTLFSLKKLFNPFVV
jgi:hypothetical protein